MPHAKNDKEIHEALLMVVCEKFSGRQRQGCLFLSSNQFLRWLFVLLIYFIVLYYIVLFCNQLPCHIIKTAAF